MSILLSLAVLATAEAAARTVAVEHRGGSYDVTHRAVVQTAAKTVGAATGTRPDGRSCRLTSVVRIEREVRGRSGAVTAMLPDSQTVRSQTPGACLPASARTASHEALVQRTAARFLDAAHGGRGEALAAIDAIHATARE